MIPTKKELLKSLIGKKVSLSGSIMKYDPQNVYTVINEVGEDMIEYTRHKPDGTPMITVYLSIDSIPGIEKM